MILNDISFTAPAGKRIGIVGRTGAGKSSIIQVLFRLVEPELGSSLRVGGCDALKMGLHSLRKHISVIPQTPFLFKGTIKQNIDPFEHSNDEQIWRVLEDSGLKTHVQSVFFILFSSPSSCRPISQTPQNPFLLAKNSCFVLRELFLEKTGFSYSTRLLPM